MLFILYYKLKGRVIFFGSASDAQKYFIQELNYKVQGKLQNPAEFFIDISSGRILSDGFKKPRQAEDLEIQFSDSSYAKRLTMMDMKKIDESVAELRFYDWEFFKSVINPFNVRKDSVYVSSKYTQIKMLLHRSFISKIRDIDEISMNLGKSIALAIILGTVYYNQGDLSTPFFQYANVQSGPLTIDNFLLITAIITVLDNITVVTDLCNRLQLYRIERASNVYSPFPFLMSSILMFFPFQFIYHLPYVVITYFMVHLPHYTTYFIYYLLITFLSKLGSYLFAMSLAAIIGDPVIALLIFPVTFVLQIIFCGGVRMIRDLPSHYRWITDANFLRWIYQGLMVNEWKSYDTDDGDDVFTENNYGNVLKLYNFDDYDRSTVFLIASMFIIGVTTLFAYGLRPPSKDLILVTNASDFVTVMSRTSSRIPGMKTLSRSSSINLAAGLGNTFQRMSSSTGLQRSSMKGSGNDLAKQLLPDNDNTGYGDDDDDMIEQDAVMEYEGAKNVEFYRLSTGHTTASDGCIIVFNNVECRAVLKKSYINMLSSMTTVLGKTSDDDNNTNTGYLAVNDDVAVATTTTTTSSSSSSATTTTTKANDEITLLHGVSGYINPSEMCVILGADGAGKTTLLDILAQRQRIGVTVTAGKITYDGKDVLKSSAYVKKEMVYLDELTVKEHIYYSALLLLDEYTPLEKIEKRVDKIMKMLGLVDVQSSPIGNITKRGISSGQLKRLTIAIEIVNLPDVMFLDEPTTGLDSTMALEVMSAIRNIANQNRTIVCTVTSPSEELYGLFDTALFLTQGKDIYFGPASEIVRYFTVSPFQFKMDDSMNSTDFILSIANSYIRADNGQLISKDQLSRYYHSTMNYKAVKDTTDPPVLPQSTFHSKRRASMEVLMKKNEFLHSPEESKAAVAASGGGGGTTTTDTKDGANDGSKSSNRLVDEPNSLKHQIKVLLERRFVILKKDASNAIGPIAR